MEEKERALIVGLHVDGNFEFEHSMEELLNLVMACDMNPVARVDQNLPSANQGFYIGTGKVDEVKEIAVSEEIDIIVFNDALSPTQLRNLQRQLELPILDRTALILEIFSKRAKTKEAKMQVEVARLQYLMPRLVGLHASLGRQGGGSGVSNKGSGEKKIELDKRRIKARIHELELDLEQVAHDREIQRKQRMNSGIPRVALVGYTNAGKSTIMNAFVDKFVKDDEKKVFAKDMLFATLDTTVRKIAPKDKKAFLLSDTVGFVSKLPHDLVKAFRSTLEEVREADLLLHVVDFSDANFKEQIAITEGTLRELGADNVPVIYVYNKADINMDVLPLVKDDGIYMSAKTKEGLDELQDLIEKKLFISYQNCDMLIPYTDGKLLSYFKEHTTVDKTEYLEDGIHISVHCSEKDYQKYKQYLVKEDK